MELIKKYTYNKLSKLIVGKKVHFTSDCEFFPNFNVKGKVIGISQRPGEILFKFLTNNGKTITIGSNMKNLKFEFI